MEPKRIAPDLWLIPLNLSLVGFTDFIGAWVLQREQTIIIDVGPSVTIPALIEALHTLNIKRPDLILTTHIHLDHAGGLGHFIRQIPDVPVVCHSSAITHLINPQRLWQGSLKTLGTIAQAYSEPEPVPESLLTAAEDFSSDAIIPIITPGHAPHHVSYACGSYLFAGETGGVHIELPSGTYLRPATPPKFYPETALASLKKIQQIPCELLCYGHFGAVKKSEGLLEAHQQQIQHWADIIQNVMNTNPDDPVNACLKQLLKQDPFLQQRQQLDPLIWKRELFFLKNSIKGYLGAAG